MVKIFVASNAFKLVYLGLVLGAWLWGAPAVQAQHHHGHHHHHHHHGGIGIGYNSGFYSPGWNNWGNGLGYGGSFCGGNSISLSVGYRPAYSAYGYRSCYAPIYSYPTYRCYSPPVYRIYSGYNGCYNSIGSGYTNNYYAPYYGTLYDSGTGAITHSLPTLTLPAEVLYGADAVRPRPAAAFSGTSGPSTAELMVREAAKAVLLEKAARERFVAAPKPVRESSIADHRRADQQVAQGDILFREQKYHQAAQRYKLAVEAAPDMAEPFWRLGHAYVASNRYELASAAFKRAASSKGELDRAGFSLQKLYGDANLARAAHVESLAGDALAKGDAADPLYVLAVTLHYSGEAETAAKFFAKAHELSGHKAPHVAKFLKASDGKILPVTALRELDT